MAQDLPFLSSTLGADACSLGEVAAAIKATGSWERFLEVRMGAGPTVRIDATGPTSENYLTTVTWGSQRGEGRMRSISAALVLVDKLACVFYEIRRDADKGDVV